MCEILLAFLRLLKFLMLQFTRAHVNVNCIFTVDFSKTFVHSFIHSEVPGIEWRLYFIWLAGIDGIYAFESADYLVILVHGDKYIDQSYGQPMILKFQKKTFTDSNAVVEMPFEFFWFNFIAFHACCAQVQSTFKKKGLKINQLNLELQSKNVIQIIFRNIVKHEKSFGNL